MAAVVATANARIALRASIQSVELNLTEISIIVGWPAGSRFLIITCLPVRKDLLQICSRWFDLLNEHIILYRLYKDRLYHSRFICMNEFL